MASPTTGPLLKRSSRSRNLLFAIVLVVLGLGLYPIGRQLWAAWHYQAAQSAVEKRDFPAARRHFEKSLRVWNSSGEAHFHAARAARRNGDLEEAERLLQEAQRLNWVPEAIAVERALLRVQQGDYRVVLSYLMNCVRRNHPDSLLIIEILVPPLTVALDIGPLMECLEKWTEIEPANPQPFFRKAQFHERYRQWNDSMANYRRAVELAPADAEIRFRFGSFLLGRKSPDEAYEHLEFARQNLDAAPRLDRTQVLVRLGICLHELGRDDEARRLLQQLRETQPNDPTVLTLMGQIELDLGNFEQAESYLRQAEARARYEPALLSALERCLRLNQKTAEAAEIAKRMTRVEADLKELDQLARESSLSPADPEPRRQIAIRLMRNGVEHEAKRWLDSALQRDPNHAPTHSTMADYYEQVGDLTRAAEHREMAKALTKKP